jgi:hypothetical protein
MSTTQQTAEERVARLIEDTNLANGEALKPWNYELTVEVANIGVAATDVAQTLQINPDWLRFVVSSEDFKACVADEIVAWYLIQELTTAS